ncbi:carbohydrate ABC transporter permease [Leucobacter triazinivorans]|nr:carbohydrate ABC transporter permease [Leucobacter triazinivorans]
MTTTSLLLLPQGKKPKRRMDASRVLLLALMIVAGLTFVAPILGILFTSMRTEASIANDGLWTWSAQLTADNYVRLWAETGMWRYIVNSFLITVPATLISVALGVLSGYSLAKFKPRGEKFITLFLVSGLFIPPQILLLPLFRSFTALNLYDTLWPMIIVHAGYGVALCTLMMKNFFESIPDELREAGIIDGAGELRVLVSLVLPVARPALAALATLQFTFIWNDFLYPLVFTRSDEMKSAMVGLLALQGPYTTAYGIQAAVAVCASLPTIIIFIFFQKQFTAGLTAGAVKG